MIFVHKSSTKFMMFLTCAVLLSLAANTNAWRKPSSENSLDYLIPGVPQGVAFTSNRDGNNEIYVMNPDGSGQTRKTDNAANDQRPDISPNGEIVFASNRDGNFEIFVMNFDGTNIRQLTTTVAPTANSWPRWSPDGQWIAFQSGSGTSFHIFRIRPDGTGLIQITQPADAALNQFPEWSPDGSRLVIRRGTEIFLINSSDGSSPLQLTFTSNIPGAFNQMASFSPDGTQIAFLSNRAGYLSVYIMSADGGGQINFTPRPEGYTGTWTSRAPAWSPDGQYFYFTAVRSLTSGSAEQLFFKSISSISSEETPLTASGANFEQTVRSALATTAAGVAISGRVMTPGGGGLRNARVWITDASGGSREVLTSSLGYFSFEDIFPGETYVIGVTSKRYRFNTRVLQVVDTLTDVDFAALE